MVIDKRGNILDANEEIICHQVNCKGVMGAGLALQIRKKWPQAYRLYVNTCAESYPEQLLGQVQFVNCDDGKTIANIFGQNGYGTASTQTDYKALNDGLNSVFYAVKYTAGYKDKKIAIPFKIGCGLAGGDWNVVLGMIYALSYNYDVDVTIYRL